MANTKELSVKALELSEGVEINKKQAEEFTKAVFEAIVELNVEGEEVSIAGFGKFSVAERSARKGRNPQTGNEIEIPASKAPKFKPLGKYKEAVK